MFSRRQLFNKRILSVVAIVACILGITSYSSTSETILTASDTLHKIQASYDRYLPKYGLFDDDEEDFTDRTPGLASPRADPQLQNKQHLFLQDRNSGKIDPIWQSKRNWNFTENPTNFANENMKTCLTYQERYRDYNETLSPLIPLPPTQSRTTFLIRMRDSKLVAPMMPDRLRHVRAAITELQQGTGMDVYIVVNIPENQNEEDYLETVEPELRSRIVLFTWEDVTRPYIPNTFKNIVWDNHAAVNWFLDSPYGKQYDYVWWIEEDVRSTGSWTTFYNFVNATIPREMPEPYPWELRNKTDYDVQTMGPWQPDLILTRLLEGVVHEELFTAGPGPACRDFVPLEDMAKAFIMLTGMSRHMHETMKGYYATGHSCFCEYFTSTVAKRHRIPTYVLELPRHINPNLTGGDITTWAEPRAFAADPYYWQWKDHPETCRPGPALLHKIHV